MIAVAIDGPSGAGKSTLSKRAAEALGYLYVDTGACYRGVAYFAAKNGADLKDAGAVSAVLEKLCLELDYDSEGYQRIFANAEDISEKIRTPEMSEGASLVSAIPQVREWLLDTQRNMAKTQNIIMDGRDIGTVVLPDAEVKIFLTAAPEERAARRHKEYLAKGEKIEYNQVLEDIVTRDNRDTSRKIAPLKQAEDAVLLDSTKLSFEETLSEILKIIKNGEAKHVL